ncbi:MAG: DUF6089 family protein [Ferruginibacter sp.]
MKLKIFIALTALTLTLAARAQNNNMEYVQQGEFGVTVGMAHYFGDLNTRAGVNRPKPAAGIFYRKQFGNYIGARLAARYAQVGYSDVYSKNAYQKLRNLSFNSNIWEIALQGDFNFFKFVPGDWDHAFTPYVTLGVGLFSYDPYTYLKGQKIFLRPLGTEGQNIGYKGRSEYSTMSFSIPFGVGIKYNINQKFNLTFEVAHRFTGTDYLDDVSTTFIGADKFLAGSNAALLQDRRFEIDTDSFKEGQQRGWSKQKDAFIIAEVGISFNLSSYRCPSAF